MLQGRISDIQFLDNKSLFWFPHYLTKFGHGVFLHPVCIIYVLLKKCCYANHVINVTVKCHSLQLHLYTRAVHKETELFLFLIYCFTYNLIKFVSFKVLPSALDTPLPMFFPVLECILERVLRDGAKVPCRIFFYLLYRLKSGTF